MALPSQPVPGEGSTTAIISWFLLVVSTFAISTRIATKWATRRLLNLDDAFAVVGLAFNVGSSVAVHVQARHGLGYSVVLFSKNDETTFLKALYALSLMYIPTICFAKLSILALFLAITPSQTHHRVAGSIAALIAVGAIAEEFAIAFQCDGPQQWNILSDKCFDRIAFWRFVSVFNIITDIALTVLPFVIIIPIQMSTRKKLLLLTSFSTRFFDVVASAFQLSYTDSFGSPDISREIWKWVLVTRLTQCTSIVTSCVPYLRPLLESLPTGMFLSDELRRRGYDASYIKSQQHPVNQVIRVTTTSSVVRVSTMSPTKRTHSYLPQHDTIVENFNEHDSADHRLSDATGMSSTSRSGIIPKGKPIEDIHASTGS